MVLGCHTVTGVDADLNGSDVCFIYRPHLVELARYHVRPVQSSPLPFLLEALVGGTA